MTVREAITILGEIYLKEGDIPLRLASTGALIASLKLGDEYDQYDKYRCVYVDTKIYDDV